jgi:hypothetical protein
VTSSRPLRVEPPTLEPDGAFLALLADTARLSALPTWRRTRHADLRVLVATGAIAVVTAGGAYAAGVIEAPHIFAPLHDRPKPAPPSGEQLPASPEGGDVSGQGQGQGSGHGPKDKPAAEPTDHPGNGNGNGNGPQDHPTGRPTDKPDGKPTATPGGKPADKPGGKP